MWLTGSARFPTRQRSRRTAERQVIQAYIDKEAQTAVNLLQYEIGNLFFFLAKLQVIEEFQGFSDRQAGHIGHVAVIDRNGKAFLPETMTLQTSHGLSLI